MLPNYFINYIYHNNSTTFILSVNQNNFISLNEIVSFMTRIQPTRLGTDHFFGIEFLGLKLNFV